MLGPRQPAEHFGDPPSGMIAWPLGPLSDRSGARASAAAGSGSGAGLNEGRSPSTARRSVLLVAEMPLLEDGLINLLQEKCQDISFMTSDLRSEHEARGARPDLIIMNTEQEMITGQWVRSQMDDLQARYKDTPVLLISGLDMSVEAKNAIEAGFTGFVPSTQSSDQLIAAIRLILAGGRFYLHLDQSEKSSDA